MISVYFAFFFFSLQFMLLLPLATGGKNKPSCALTPYNRRQLASKVQLSGCALTNSIVNINTKLFFPYLVYNFWIYVLAVFVLPFTMVLASYTKITSLKMTG